MIEGWCGDWNLCRFIFLKIAPFSFQHSYPTFDQTLKPESASKSMSIRKTRQHSSIGGPRSSSYHPYCTNIKLEWIMRGGKIWRTCIGLQFPFDMRLHITIASMFKDYLIPWVEKSYRIWADRVFDRGSTWASCRVRAKFNLKWVFEPNLNTYIT
jgi:hypothetical protein